MGAPTGPAGDCSVPSPSQPTSEEKGRLGLCLYAPGMSNLETRELRVFVTVAQLGGFSAGARELGIGQPSVSRTVSALERRLGVALIQRTTHSFRLTPAGDTLLSQALLALDAVTAAERLTRRHAQGDPHLVVAMKSDSDAGLLPLILELCIADEACPSVQLLFRKLHQLAEAVRTGAADVCLISGPLDTPGLDRDELCTEPRVVVMHRDHALLAREALGVADFTKEPVARWPHLPAGVQRYYQGIDSLPASSGVIEGPPVTDLADALRLVELGRAVIFLPESVARRFDRPGLATRPVVGLSDSHTAVAWRANSRDSALAAFVAAAHAAAATRSPVPPAQRSPRG
ncbi:MAG: LysR family transcriptional regulator [Pseudonocardiales bacterium]|nr:MAG: LysR family transcriptional regulator [Pseudonocardiales bacterium]